MDNDNALNSIKNNTNSPPETEEKPEISSADEKPETDLNTAPAEEAVVVAEEEEVVSQSEPEKPAEEPAPEPILPETPVFDPAQPLPSTEPKKKKSKFLPLLVIILLLLLGACGACYYIIVYRPDLNPFKSHAPAPAKLEPSEPEETEEEETAVETEITDEATKSALFEKLFAIHIPRTIKQFKSDETFKPYELIDNAYFVFSPGYNVTKKYYSGDLTEADKLYTITHGLHMQKKLKTLSELGLPEDFYEKLYPDLAQKTDLKEAYKYGAGIEQSVVEDLYKNLFGTLPKHQETTPEICGHLVYNAEYEIYHTEAVSGCGGMPTYQHLYVIGYKQKGKKGYIDVAITEEYNDYLAPTEAVITSDNYKDFSQYRFVFEDDGTGNYVYKTTEKLN